MVVSARMKRRTVCRTLIVVLAVGGTACLTACGATKPQSLESRVAALKAREAQASSQASGREDARAKESEVWFVRQREKQGASFASAKCELRFVDVEVPRIKQRAEQHGLRLALSVPLAEERIVEEHEPGGATDKEIVGPSSEAAEQKCEEQRFAEDQRQTEREAKGTP